VSVTAELVVGSDVTLDRGGRELLRRFRRLARGEQVAAIALVLVLLISLLGPFLAPYSPTAPVGPEFTHPGHAGFLFGTDDLGHDIFSRILYGARESWLGAFGVIGFGVLVGTAIGLAAGTYGGWIDAVLMRLTDAFLALPAPVLALAIAAALGPSYVHTLIAVAVVWWPLYARIVRAEIRAFVSRPNIEAARLAGVSRRRLLLRHLLPGAIPPIVIAASLDVGGLILTVSGLSFLGLGSPEPAPELGAMTAQGLQYLLSDSWIPLFPAIAIFVIALCSNLGGDAIRDLLEE
jgi:peptide/nickel transport system permease protein